MPVRSFSARPPRASAPKPSLQAAGCGGCTQSLLGGEGRAGGLAQLADSGIELCSHPGLSEASGNETLLLRAAAAGRLPFDLLWIEGALLRGPNGSGRFQTLAGRPLIDWVRDLALRARHVLAIGTCRAYGGIISGGENRSDACGLQFDGDQQGGLLAAEYRSLSGLPVINVAGCPTHPGWVVDTLLALALDALAATDLDVWQRPRRLPASRPGCRSTCRKRGSSRWPLYRSRRRRSVCARIRAPITR